MERTQTACEDCDLYQAQINDLEDKVSDLERDRADLFNALNDVQGGLYDALRATEKVIQEAKR